MKAEVSKLTEHSAAKKQCVSIVYKCKSLFSSLIFGSMILVVPY